MTTPSHTGLYKRLYNFGNISTKKSGSNSAIQQTEQNKITKLNNNNKKNKKQKNKNRKLGNEG